MKRIVGIVIFCSALLFLQKIYSDGALDTTFGSLCDSLGFVTGATCLLPSGIRIQANGGIVVGYTNPYVTSAIVRYLSDGCLDTTFNGTGYVVGPGGIVWDVMIQYNDQIVIGGQSGTTVLLARYNWDGTLDRTFGSSGIVSGSTSGYCTALAQDTSGKIIVAGTNNAGNVLLQRYTTAGVLDGTFTAAAVAGCARDVIVQENGFIVIAGAHNAEFLLARYTTTGALDTTFNSTGIVNATSGIANRILQQTNQYLVVGGSDFNGNIQMARYTTAGVLDTTFNSTGIVTGPSGIINDMALQTNGSIVISGQNAYQQNTLLMRYTSSGAVDSTFGSSGSATVYTGYWNGMALQQNGYIVLMGVDGTYSEMQLARFVNSQPMSATDIVTQVLNATGSSTITGAAQNPSNVYFFINGVFQSGVATNSGLYSWTNTATFSEDGLYMGRASADNKNTKNLMAQVAPIRVSNV